MKHNTPFLGRIHTLAFVFLCIGASIFGAILFFLVSVFCLGFVEALIGQGPQSIYQGPTLMFTFVGFVLPVVLLARRRKRYRRSSATVGDNSSNRDQTSENPDHGTNEDSEPQSAPTAPDQPPSAPGNQDIWHYTDGGKRLGPVS